MYLLELKVGTKVILAGNMNLDERLINVPVGKMMAFHRKGLLVKTFTLNFKIKRQVLRHGPIVILYIISVDKNVVDLFSQTYAKS